MRKTLALILLATASVAMASPGPYDEAADAKTEIATTLAEAQRAKLPVLVVFGANWCGDCKVLDMAFKSGAAAALMAQNFRVVKVDVGRFTKNTDIAEAYGVVLKKGIPAVALLSSEGKPIYATKAGELSNARQMGDQAIYDFFAKVAKGG